MLSDERILSIAYYMGGIGVSSLSSYLIDISDVALVISAMVGLGVATTLVMWLDIEDEKVSNSDLNVCEDCKRYY